MYKNSLETDPKGEASGGLETLLVRHSKVRSFSIQVNAVNADLT